MIAKIAMYLCKLVYFDYFSENSFLFQQLMFLLSSRIRMRCRGQEIVAIVERTNFSGSSFYIEDSQGAKIVFAMQAAENTKVGRMASTLEARVGLPSPRN